MKKNNQFKIQKAIALLILTAFNIAIADEERGPVVVNQHDVRVNGCGPCSVANFLLNGSLEMREAFHRSDTLSGVGINERSNSIIERYMTVGSKVRQGRPRFLDGISPFDMLPAIQDLRNAGFPIPAMRSQLLIRGGTNDEYGKDESDSAHLQRVHQILSTANKGVPVIIQFWRFEATKEDGKEFIWDFDYGHYLTILSVETEIQKHAKGFSFVYADSAGGEVAVAYAHTSERPFRARRWNSYSDEFIDSLWPNRKERGLEQWPSKKEMPRPYITLTMPSRDDDRSMSLRKVCALTVAIYPDEK